jgi:hypothetical protein
MMERIYNPILFSNDPMIQRPHLALTAYDEIAIALRNYAGLNFEYGLKLQQIIFRACAAAGLLLIALRLGLSPPAAFFAAAVVILNVGISELDPVARAFTLGLMLLGVGLAIGGHDLAAGLIFSLGFLIHPTAALPFWVAAVYAVLRRSARPILLVPLPVAVSILLVLMRLQTGGTETLNFFGTVEPFQESLQRRFMGPNFISEWSAKDILELICECTVVLVAFWRLRERLQPPLRDWLWALGGIAALSIPFSWVVLDRLHWAMAGPWVPLRALVLVTLLASLLSAAAGMEAARKGIWWETPIWMAIALALPVKDHLATWWVDPRLVALVLALVGTSAAGLWLADRTRGVTLFAAGILPFIAFSASGLVPKPRPADSPELKELAAWALKTTDETAVFLFADEGSYAGSGPFRARALRSIYVDYEGRALVNYYPEFSADWIKRWEAVHEGRWLVTTEDFQDLASRRIDHVVLKKEHAIPSKQPEFSNLRYVVYAVAPNF